MSTLVLIHTVQVLLDEFKRMCSKVIPDVELMHVLDEPLLRIVQKRGKFDKQDVSRMRSHAEAAEKAGADAILVTCSTLSPLVDEVRPSVGIPIVKIDEAMIQAAVEQGNTIGVVATAESTLKPTCDTLFQYAVKYGKSIRTEKKYVEDAIEALINGDGNLHDELVKKAIADLSQRVEIIILAQASMARVLDIMEEENCNVPILSSPYIALRSIRQYL